MDYYDFYQKHYFFELNRRVQLTNSLMIPIGAVTLFGGILSYYFRNFVFLFDFTTLLFIIFNGISLYHVLRIIYFLFKSYYNYEYSYINSLDKIRTFQFQLAKYNKKKNSNSNDDGFENDLINKYADGASVNALNNNLKSEFLHKCNRSLMYLIIFVFVLSPVFFINHFYATNNKYNHDPNTLYFFNYNGEGDMFDDTDKDNNASNNDESEERPTFPPNKLIKEDGSEKEDK